MTKTTSFALRLPPELKAAAAALKDVHGLYRPSRNGLPDHLSGVSTDSINEVICTLMIEGLEPMLGYVQKALDEAAKELSGWQEVVAFGIANPTAKSIKAGDVAGAAAKAAIEYWQDYEGDHREDIPDDDLIGLGVPLANAANGFGWCQKKVAQLTAAKGAIMNVLGPLEAQAKETPEERMARFDAERAARVAEIERDRADRDRKQQVRSAPQLSVVASDTQP